MKSLFVAAFVKLYVIRYEIYYLYDQVLSRFHNYFDFIHDRIQLYTTIKINLINTMLILENLKKVIKKQLYLS